MTLFFDHSQIFAIFCYPKKVTIKNSYLIKFKIIVVVKICQKILVNIKILRISVYLVSKVEKNFRNKANKKDDEILIGGDS